MKYAYSVHILMVVLCKKISCEEELCPENLHIINLKKHYLHALIVLFHNHNNEHLIECPLALSAALGAITDQVTHNQTSLSNN